MSKVILVAAPFLSLQRPALGISLLKAGLARRGIDCSIRYLNLEYAEFEDPDFCQTLAEHVPTHHLLGEWVFSHLVNGTNTDPDMEKGSDWVKSRVTAEFANRMETAKSRAALFVEQCTGRILADRPKLVGFSTTFQQNCASLAIAARIKALSPETTVVFGGANCEGPMGKAMGDSFRQIDFVISGEADDCFPPFVEKVLAGERPGECQLNGLPITEMDKLPVPLYGEYFAALKALSFRHRILPTIPFESSRGCWWGAKHHCVFCGLNGQGMGFRAKSPDRLVDEIVTLCDTWGVPRFSASDNIMDMKHIDPVFARQRDELAGLSFFYEIKANLSVDHLRTIAAAGVTWVQPGIESLDDDILKLMSKGVRALQNVLLLRTAREIGMRVYWNILAGFPGETPAQYEQMAAKLPLLQHLEKPTGLSQLRIDRFSPYHSNPGKAGFQNLRPLRSYRAVYDLPDETLMDLAYFFDGDRDDGRELSDYVDPVIERILDWHGRAGGEHPALLQLHQIGPFAVVRDTRDCAVEAEHTLSSDEWEVLSAFDQPSSIAGQLGGLAKSWSHERSPEAIFKGLVDLKYILVDKGTAIQLVIDPDRRQEGMALPSEFPGGTLLAAHC